MLQLVSRFPTNNQQKVIVTVDNRQL